MALTSSYVLPITRIPDLFSKIRDGQAPDRLHRQLLKDWGFTSSNDAAFIPLLKALGFLSPDGKPTQRYLEYRDHSRSKAIMGDALREAYGDLFLIKSNPTDSDKAAIEGKFKSFHNVSENVSNLMMRTFFALLALADISQASKTEKRKKDNSDDESENDDAENDKAKDKTKIVKTGLHYNIQIHLPATKDLEVYNAIFKSLKEHLLAE